MVSNNSMVEKYSNIDMKFDDDNKKNDNNNILSHHLPAHHPNKNKYDSKRSDNSNLSLIHPAGKDRSHGYNQPNT